jgi:CheY-like chemotaxis protein
MAVYADLVDVESAPRAPRYVLVVDDEQDVLDLVSQHLRTSGFRVGTAHSGEEGLARAYAEPPDLVILDVMLPGMDGRDVVKALRADERTAHCPIVVSTILDREDLHNVAADGVLSKPFRRAAFQTMVSGLLNPS